MHGIIFTGLQASGKSTYFLQEFYRTHIRLNMDMLKTRHREEILFQACLEGKQPVVIDNTNPSVKDRRRYISGFRKHRFSVTGYYFSSEINECMSRNALRQGKERIPDAGLRNTHSKLELPSLSEGFDHLYYVSLTKSGFVTEEWKE